MIDHITRLRAEEAGLPAAESHPDPFLVCFPMPENLLVIPEPAQFPPPLTGATTRPVDDWPGPVEQLAALAATLGWNLKVTYAHGFTPHARLGTPSAMPKESWAIRLNRGDERAVAVRMAGMWSSFWYWSPNTLMRRSDTLIDFRARLCPQGYPQPVSFPVDQG